MKSYWAYMVRCSDGSFYVGVTNGPDRRIAEHNLGLDPDCYTFTRRPVELVYSSEFHHIEEAIACEKQLKGWSRAKKLALIGNDWGAISQLAHLHPSRNGARSADKES